jgi:hypothetical protein
MSREDAGELRGGELMGADILCNLCLVGLEDGRRSGRERSGEERI